MSDSMSNDYFSFMSDKWEAKRRPPSAAKPHPLKPVKPVICGDVIEFVEEAQIEVIESVASDTIIERIFKRRISAA